MVHEGTEQGIVCLRGAWSKTLKLRGLIFVFIPPLVVQFCFQLRCVHANLTAGPSGAAEAILQDAALPKGLSGDVLGL